MNLRKLWKARFNRNISKWIQNKWHFIKIPMIISYIQTAMVMVIIPLLLVKYCEFTLGKAFLFMLIPRFGHGCIYHLFSQISHINEFAFQNYNLEMSANFMIHQIMSSQDYSVQSKLMSVIAVGLNNQTVHHLFPSVHICHYPALSPILAEFCNDHGIEFRAHESMWGAFQDYFDYLLPKNVKSVKQA